MRRLVALLFVASVLSGCAFHTMTPAHRLEAGEVVIQGSLDEPGFLYIPRVSGSLTYGFGAGDVTGHIGTTLLTANVGAEGRLYIADVAQASMEVGALLTTFEEDLLTSGQRSGFITANPRFGWIPRDSLGIFYGGFQAIGILPISVSESADVPSNPLLGVGGYAGISVDTPGSLDFQIEFSANPVGIYEEEDAGAYVLSPLPIAQFAIGLQYRKETEPPPMRPTDDTAPDEQRRIY